MGLRGVVENFATRTRNFARKDRVLIDRELETVSQCPVCHGPGDAHLSRVQDFYGAGKGEWSYLKCQSQNCGSLWLSPRIPESLAFKLYDQSYSEALNPKVRTRTSLGYDILKSTYRKLIGRNIQSGDAVLSYLETIPKGRILDLGAGDGRLALKLIAQGWVYEGLEWSAEIAAGALAENYTVHPATVANFNPVEPYDVVLLNHVVEHLYAPVLILAKAKTFLRPGGRVVCSTPNASAFLNRLFGRRWTGYHPPFHVQLFSAKSLAAMLATAGFENVRTFAQNAQILQELWLANAMGVELKTQKPSARFVLMRIGMLALNWLQFIAFRLSRGNGENLIGIGFYGKG